MATGPRRPIIRTIENPWTCKLLASPDRVQGGGDVTFTVKLSNPGIAQIFSGSDGTIAPKPSWLTPTRRHIQSRTLRSPVKLLHPTAVARPSVALRIIIHGTQA